VNFQTALALERRGLVAIDKQMDGWDIALIDGSKVVGQAPANAQGAVREPEPCPTHIDGVDDAQ
jgi:hypothetical protein